MVIDLAEDEESESERSESSGDQDSKTDQRPYAAMLGKTVGDYRILKKPEVRETKGEADKEAEVMSIERGSLSSENIYLQDLHGHKEEPQEYPTTDSLLTITRKDWHWKKEL